MIKAIIFDCFGVLVGKGFRQTYAAAGGNPVKDSVFIAKLLDEASLGLITPDEMSQKITESIGISHETWHQAVVRSEQPDQTLLKFIKELKKSYKVAILSNANIGVLQHKFTPQQLQIFDAVVVSAEVGMIKPSPQIYEYTAKKLAVETVECVFIDDREAYCQAAIAVGMQAIWFKGLSQFKAEIERILYLE